MEQLYPWTTELRHGTEWHVKDSSEEEICWILRRPDVEQTASLISAAPELLDSASKCLALALRDGWENHADILYCQAYARLRGAFAKAQGVTL